MTISRENCTKRRLNLVPSLFPIVERRERNSISYNITRQKMSIKRNKITKNNEKSNRVIPI
uniref:Uncharacterized protein n=1 Tax=Glycine max TaxID=3847 RepID=C6TM25_SOYBN|nr:unknown [Glycine max]